MRDQNHPSHPQIPLYKGIPINYVRDEGFLRAVFTLIVSSIYACNENTARLPVADSQS